MGDLNDDPNNASVVLTVRIGDFDALLTGDVEAEAGRSLRLTQQANLVGPQSNPRFDVVKAPHHGSANYDDILFAETRAPVTLVSVGAIIRFTVDGDSVGLLALFSGAFFIPSLALASGLWSGTSKLFEILYMLIWYLGPLNKLMALDYIGSHGNGRPEFFIPFSIVLIVLAFIGRTRQIRI